LVDTHCHLNFHSFKKDYQEVAQAAYDIGVTKIINVGAKLDSSRKAVKLANEIPFCSAAVGVHPHHTDEFQDLGGLDKDLEQVIQDDLDSGKKIVAIGECGLDYHEYSTPDAKIAIPSKKNQIELLKLHFHFAKKYDLPLIIHCRDAYSNLLSLLHTTDYVLRTNPGVIHCFQGNVDELKQFLDLGFFIGFDGYITYEDKVQNVNLKMKKLDPRFRGDDKNGSRDDDSFIRENPLEILVDPKDEQQIALTRYEELVFNTPIDRILTETDSPWLTPVPFRGTRNSPSNIKIITEKIAKIKGLSFEETDQITTANAEKLFFHIS
jgi:TatD DNase family protein